MQWQEICDDKLLQDLPYKIELNRWGQIIMSPAKVKHGFYQNKIAYFLESLITEGEVITECAIQTTDNVKVADVAWASDERANIINIILDEVSASIAPEVFVEVISASNTDEEMTFKKNLYFQARAEEIWICDRLELMTFLKADKQLDKSELVPDFRYRLNAEKNNKLVLESDFFIEI